MQIGLLFDFHLVYRLYGLHENFKLFCSLRVLENEVRSDGRFDGRDSVVEMIIAIPLLDESAVWRRNVDLPRLFKRADGVTPRRRIAETLVKQRHGPDHACSVLRRSELLQ